MQVYNLQPKSRFKKSKKVGRGGKRGTYSGRGQKGQKARAGAKFRPPLRELILKIPKRRGLGLRPKNKAKPIIVKLEQLEKMFLDGSQITPKTLLKMNLIKTDKVPVKILGNYPVMKKFIIKNCLISQSARQMIERRGGKIE